MMVRTFSAAFAMSLVLASGFAGQAAKASEYDHLVAKHATAHGVPESLVRRIIHIESKGNPRVVSSGNYGLMQIRLGTARAMGYSGGAEGLLDPDTNMAYAVKYLAGAYRAARGNPELAIRNYQRGYYAAAKAQGFSPYAVASAPPQAAAPDPALLPQQSDRQQTVEQQRAAQEAAQQARLAQQQAAEAVRAAQRQAMVQEKMARQQAIEQQRLAQRQAMLQQQVDREYARQQQQVEREQVKQQQIIEQQQQQQSRIEPQRPPSAQPAPSRAAAAAPAYAWYNPMRFFKHPAHQSHPHKAGER